MSDVFISYSRRNSDFARRLIDRLTRANKESWVDWEGIPLSSPNWWNEIKAGIENADSFIFIMSPDSMASVVCNLELDYANELRKRIIPVVHQEIESREAFASIADFEPDEAMRERLEGKDALVIARDNWQRLSHINWIFFRENDDFDQAFAQLVETVETDLDYVKAHTRYLTRAKEWERTGRPNDLLLFGEEIDRAETLQRAYIATSRATEEDRQRRLKELENARLSSEQARKKADESRRRATRTLVRVAVGSGILIFVALVVSISAFRQTNIAEAARIEAESARVEAEAAQNEAATQVAELEAIVPGATQGSLLSHWEGLLDPQVKFNLATTQLAPIRYSNTFWTPIEQDFNGVAMMLVPVGCFHMGSENGDSDEMPSHQQCFEQPFWIDKYEVTNEQYGSAHANVSTQPDQPHIGIDWFDASDHCSARDARLPTETEWEYAARGPDSLEYPWGNEYDATLVIGTDDPSGLAPVGSRPEGASWVGAMDMSGNASEWTSSRYKAYPYEEITDFDVGDLERDLWETQRVWRGGSFLGNSKVLRSSERGWASPVSIHFSIGFRCTRSVEQ